MRGVNHIVWDWNGTLLNDSHAVVAAVNEVCAVFGREPVDLDEWRSIFSRPLLACYERLLRQPISTHDWARIDRLYHDAYRELLHTCQLAAGVPDELHRWRGGGRGQSLLSMWFHQELVQLVAERRLAELFTRIDGLRIDVGGGSKAEHLVEHLSAQQLRPSEVVVIGDVADDAVAADHVGARCVLVATGMTGREQLVDHGAPVVDSIPDALRLIEV